MLDYQGTCFHLFPMFNGVLTHFLLCINSPQYKNKLIPFNYIFTLNKWEFSFNPIQKWIEGFMELCHFAHF